MPASFKIMYYLRYIAMHRVMDTTVFKILNDIVIEYQLETIVNEISEQTVIRTLPYLSNFIQNYNRLVILFYHSLKKGIKNYSYKKLQLIQ